MENDIRWQIKSFEELISYELYQLLQLRTDVFVVEQNCPYREVDGIDLEATHLLGFIKENLMAYARCYSQEGKGIIGRVVVRKDHRGRGWLLH